MKKDTLYKILIGFLLIINIAQLSFSLIGNKPIHHPSHGKDQINKHIRETLNLSDTQFENFQKLAEKHREDMIVLNKAHNEIAMKYFESPADSILKNMNKLENQKIKITQNHFDDIKSLLNKDQAPNFNDFKSDVLDHILR